MTKSDVNEVNEAKTGSGNACLLYELVGPCPGCGSEHLRVVSTGETNNLLCLTCGACWHGAITGVERVDPMTCRGCGHQKVCFAALGERSP